MTLARGNILDRYGVPLHYPVWGNALVRLDESPDKVARELSPAEAASFLADGDALEYALVPEEIRYGRASLACHVVGYVRANAYIDSRDNVGESGLEKTFQDVLAGGTAAWSGVVVTAEGSDLPGTGLRIAPPSSAPQDVYTTIDAGAQRAVEEVLDQNKVASGAVVVLDARTSEILAMASRPEFDQNHPEESFAAEGAPFVNRAVSAFTPGSVFKPVIACLALEKGYATPDEVFLCTGEIDVGGRKIACGTAGSGHGRVTLKDALAVSCNTALITIGLRIPPREMVDFVEMCGFGLPCGIPLDEESAGTLPDPGSMYAGDIANMCIGQGRISVTPLQIAAFFAAIAEDGVYRPPILVTAGAGTVSEGKRLMSEETAKLIQESLLAGARRGTGRLAWVQEVGSAGKTGTAETGGAGLSHAWFCGFTPVIAPKYVICVFLEEGGDGPGVAAPIFREVASRLTDTHGSTSP